MTLLTPPQQINSVINQIGALPQFPDLNTLADLCVLLEAKAIGEGVFISTLSSAGVSNATISDLFRCLAQAELVFE